MFQVELSNLAKRFLRKVNKEIYERIIKKIRQLRETPFIPDTKRVEGTDYFRVRIGAYRILYTVKHKENVILIANIDKRPKVYK